MKRLWAPWRMEYISRGDLENDECFLCEKQKNPENDDEDFVLYRGEHCYALMNTYPYNNGHLMIATYRHIGDFTKLTKAELVEMMEITRIAVSAITESMGAQGFNIGFNLGCVAGAGVVDHIHLHIVPRWGGDTNFMPVIADTKVVSEALKETYERLFPYFEKNNIPRGFDEV
ncbi:HIT family hydrolase [bacterium]|nr:MAG: HIT family hydrolase [bacterium]